VFSGEVGPAVLNAISDPSYPFVLPEGATAATLDLNTQLGAIDEVIKGKVLAIANNYGISSDNFNVTGSNMSGYALKISNRALEEIREADKTVVLKVEKELFDLIRYINNTIGLEQIPEDVDLKWNPGEISYPPTAQEEQARWEFEFQNGISNQVDYLLEQDPEMTREDAMEVLRRVKEESAELKPARSVLETIFEGGEGRPAFGAKGKPEQEQEEEAGAKAVS